MKILRTPDSQFEGLVDWPFEPHYTTIEADDGTPIRIHHVEMGPPDGEPILLMHGNPSWSYLHRKMIAPLAATGRRVIAVDLVGCGRSDKPAARSDYTLARHYDWMSKWLEAMQLKHITLYCQDWGGTIGLYLVSRYPERFDRVAISNSGLPLGEGANWFLAIWTFAMRFAPFYPWFMMRSSSRYAFSKSAMQAFRAPFPSRAYESALVKFPLLIAVQKNNPGAPLNREAWARLKTFDKPFLTLFGDLDPVARGLDRYMQKRVPGAKGQDHARLPGVGHFVQEEAPEILVERLTRFLKQGRQPEPLAP
jgi:haloalkane dehalogenase